jgi:hypothetical protein
VFCGRKEKRSGRLTTGAFRNSLLFNASLANFGAQEFAVALETDFAAAQEIGHCRDSFLGIFSAGADGENEIAE